MERRFSGRNHSALEKVAAFFYLSSDLLSLVFAFFATFAVYIWQVGQKCVERWATTLRAMGVPQTRQGWPVRRKT